MLYDVGVADFPHNPHLGHRILDPVLVKALLGNEELTVTLTLSFNLFNKPKATSSNELYNLILPSQFILPAA